MPCHSYYYATHNTTHLDTSYLYVSHYDISRLDILHKYTSIVHNTTTHPRSILNIPRQIPMQMDKSNPDKTGIPLQGMDRGRDNKRDKYADKSNADRISVSC